MINSDSGLSRAQQVLQALELKRRSRIDDIIERQRIELRERVLEGLDDDRDFYIETVERYSQKIRAVENEYADLMKSVRVNFQQVALELNVVSEKLKTMVKEHNLELDKTVHRVETLRLFNIKEDRAYEEQMKADQTLPKAQAQLSELGVEAKELFAKLSNMKKKGQAPSKVFREKTERVFKQYVSLKAAVEQLEKQSSLSQGAMIGKLETYIKVLREQNTNSVLNTEKNAELINLLSSENMTALEKITFERLNLASEVNAQLAAIGIDILVD